MEPSRRLAAIMFSDIVGYSAIMHSNEEKGRLLVKRYREVLNERVSAHGGEIIKHYGDGSLCIFSSAIESVYCAREIQLALQSGTIVPLRIGLHTGDIVQDGEDIFGDGVNIASRVESMGIEGAVLFTERVANDVRNHPDLAMKSMGHFMFKNIDHPMEVYALSGPGLSLPVPEQMRGKAKAFIPKTSVRNSRRWLSVLLAIVAIGIAGWQIWTVENRKKLKQDRIAVHFIDYTNLPDRADLADLTSHWITNRLMDIPGVHVVSYENVSSQREVLAAGVGEGAWRTFARRTGAVNLMQGQIFRQGDSLFFEAHITDLEDERIRQRFKQVICDVNEPLLGVQELTKKVQGWWASKDSKVITLPNYDAYKAYLDAKSVWEVNDSLSESRLINSIDIDSSFMDAYLLLMDYYYNKREFGLRDSLIQTVRRRFPILTDRQKNLIAYHEADARGDLITTYRCFRKELEHDPLDMFSNTDGMLLAADYVNSLRDAISLFWMIPLDSADIKECRYCDNRLRFAAIAYLNLGKVDSAKQITDLIPPVTARNLELKIRSRMAENDTAYINDLIRVAIGSPDINPEFVWAYVARQYKLLGKIDMLQYYANEALSHYDSTDARAGTVECNYWQGNYIASKRLIDQWLPDYAEHQYVIMFGTRAIARAGSQDEIDMWRAHLTDLAENDNYGFGLYTYMLGVMSCIMGQTEEAMGLISKAYDEGRQFKEFEPAYNNDPDLMPLFDHPEWEALMHPLKTR